MAYESAVAHHATRLRLVLFGDAFLLSFLLLEAAVSVLRARRKEKTKCGERRETEKGGREKTWEG